jgi:hypothetical protein
VDKATSHASGKTGHHNVYFGVQHSMFTFLRGLLDSEDEGTMMLVSGTVT